MLRNVCPLDPQGYPSPIHQPQQVLCLPSPIRRRVTSDSPRDSSQVTHLSYQVFNQICRSRHTLQ